MAPGGVGFTGACVAIALVPSPRSRRHRLARDIISISFIPIAIGIAILRYRLYEIDRIISRTLSYAVVTATLALVFVGGVLGLQSLLEPMTNENTVAVAASTLIVAALFEPLRRRVQSIVDRRFNRANTTPSVRSTRSPSGCATRSTSGTVTDELDVTITSALNPSTLGLWLRRASE